MKALCFGSIGVVAETSELQRQAYNMAFQDHGLDWYWSIGNYCEMLRSPGGVRRLKAFTKGKVSDELLMAIHQSKQDRFEELLAQGVMPRAGIADCVARCQDRGIKLGFITTTTKRTLDILTEALAPHIDFTSFDLLTTKADVIAEKPSSEVYQVALSRLGVAAGDCIAIEDSEPNQEAALKADVFCYLYAGDYATTRHNLNAVRNLDLIIESM